MTDATTDIILKAKALIERDGWIRKSYRLDAADGTCQGRCLVGAIRDATIALGLTPIGENRFAAYRAARERLTSRVADDNLVAWNDAPERTKAEVLELLVEAAK